MEPKGDLQHLEFDIPARGINGLRNNVLTATGGEAIMAHRFKAYEPWKGPYPRPFKWRSGLNGYRQNNRIRH